MAPVAFHCTRTTSQHQTAWHSSSRQRFRHILCAVEGLQSPEDGQAAGASVSREELESWVRASYSVQVQELGVKADFADDPDGDDIDDLLEESEDPWMREPAGLEFAGEIIDLPDIEGPHDIDATSRVHSSSTWADEVRFCSQAEAITSVNEGSGQLIALSVSDRSSELVRACVHVPLPQLTQDRYDVEGWQGKALYIVCPEQLDRDDVATREQDVATRGQDPAAEEGTGGGTGGGVDVIGRGDASGGIESSPQANNLDHSEAMLNRVEGGARGAWAEGLQACIRLQKVMGHEDVFLVR